MTKALLRGKIYGRIIAKNMVSSFFVPPVCNDVFVKNYRACWGRRRRFMKKDVINYIWTDKNRTIFGLPISFTRYFLTEDKFITRKGFLSIEEDELDLYRVIDKKLVLPFGQRMFGCGTIVMNVKDVDTPIKEVKSIKAPRDVLAQLDKYININRDRYRVRGRDMVGGDVCHWHDHDDFDINDDII